MSQRAGNLIATAITVAGIVAGLIMLGAPSWAVFGIGVLAWFVVLHATQR